MKLLKVALVIAILAGGAFWAFKVFNEDLKDEQEVTPVIEEETYTNNMSTEFSAPENKGLSESLKITEADHVIGNINAPVQIVEYMSMTCGHCAHFHAETFPKIKKDLIDTGKVLFVVREMPWDSRALATAMVISCAPKERYFTYLKVFLETQAKWAQSEDFVGAVKKIANLGGMSPEAVDSCLSDEDKQTEINEVRRIGIENLNVNATPTLFINGERVTGNQPYETILEKVNGYIK